MHKYLILFVSFPFKNKLIGPYSCIPNNCLLFLHSLSVLEIETIGFLFEEDCIFIWKYWKELVNFISYILDSEPKRVVSDPLNSKFEIVCDTIYKRIVKNINKFSCFYPFQF